MQKVRGSNPLSSTTFFELLSDIKCLIKCLRACGFSRPLVCVVRNAGVLVEHAAHDRSAAADRRYDHGQ